MEKDIDLPMEIFINDFLNDNPNFFNNDATIEEGNKDFIKTLSDLLKLNYNKCHSHIYFYEVDICVEE